MHQSFLLDEREDCTLERSEGSFPFLPYPEPFVARQQRKAVQHSRKTYAMQKKRTTPSRMASNRRHVRQTPVRGAFFYYDPDDPRLMIPNGYSGQYAVNFGHPRSWLVLGGIGVMLGEMTLLGFFSIHTFVLFFLICICFLVLWLVLVGVVIRRRIAESKTSRNGAEEHHEKRG